MAEADLPNRHLLHLLSDKWVPVLLFYLGERACRPSELASKLDGISQKMLTQTLREMEGRGIVHREIFPEVPPRVEYSLTRNGRALGELLRTICGWAAERADTMQQMGLVTDMPRRTTTDS